VSILDRKLRRELWAKLWLLLAIISIMVVGVACFVSMGSTYYNLTEAKRRYHRQCRMADFFIEVKKVPVADVRPIAELPGVAGVRARIQFLATVDLEGVREPLNGLVLSLPDRRRQVINDVVLRRGTYFTDRRQNEVIVDQSFAEKHGLGPGDWIRLVLNNRRQELFVVGTAISSEFIYMLGPGAIVPDSEHFGVFYLKHSYAEDVFDFSGAANQVLGRLAPGRKDGPEGVLAEAERLLAPYGVFSTIALKDQPSNKYVSEEIGGLKTFAVAMPCIFLAVAALVLNVLLTRLAQQQRTVMGTLKALGYSNGQISLHFLKFALCVGLAGGLLGCLLGFVLAHFQTLAYRLIFKFPQLDTRFYPGLMATAMGISLGCAVVGSLRGTRAVLRLKPAEAMRPKAPRRGGKILLERIGFLWNRLSAGWRMVLRGVVRSRVRSAAGVFAAAMGSCVLTSGFMMAYATGYLVDFQFKWIQRSDLDLTFKDEHDYAALLEASRLPGVDRAEPTLYVPCTFRHGPYHHKGGVTGLAAHARLTVPRDRRGRPIRIPASGLAMSRTLAELLHLGPGDPVTVEPTKGLRQVKQVQVMEISDSYVGTLVYAEIGYLSRLVGEEYALSGVQLALDHQPRHRAELYRRLKRMPALQGVIAREDMVQSIERTLILTMIVFIGLLVLFAGVVFFSSILNASLVSLAERQREVATLRTLGYGPWQIGSLLLRESLIVTAVGTVLGMPLGYLLTVGVAACYKSEMFRFPVVSGPSTWMLTVVLALVFTLLAYLFVQRAVHRMNWLEALQAKE